MRCIVSLTVLLLGLALCAPAARADYETGQAALERGDYAAAEAAWRPLAAEGDAQAMFGFGRLLLHKADMRGLAWIQKSAHAGHMPAEARMATYRLHALYMPHDLRSYSAWLRRVESHPKEEAAKYLEALASSYRQLAMLAHAGVFTPKSAEACVSYLRKAADLGDPIGQGNYAEHLEQGIGVAQDLVEAYKFYLLAYKQDVLPEALERANAVVGRLSPSQREDARERLRTWLKAWKAGTLGQVYLHWKRLPEGVKALERLENIHISALADARRLDMVMGTQCQPPWLRARKRLQHDARREITIEQWTLGCGQRAHEYRVTFRPGGNPEGEKQIKWTVKGTFQRGP